jgi:Arc/MetJ-type ribon-helix-helix transcriptional regulator
VVQTKLGEIRMPSQKISLFLPIELLDKIEAAAKNNYCTRSDYIRTAVVLRLDHQLNQQLNQEQSTTASPKPQPRTQSQTQLQPQILATASSTVPVVPPEYEDEFLEALLKHYTDK